jgi:hypothetical protein
MGTDVLDTAMEKLSAAVTGAGPAVAPGKHTRRGV